MNPTQILALASVLGLGAASAVASSRRARPPAAALKMAAASAYLVVALAGGARGSDYGQVILLALLLSWVGDLLLIAPGRGVAFLGGLGSFLLAHVAYAWAFWRLGVSPPWILAGALGAGLVGMKVALWLAHHDVPAAMRGPVGAYVFAITVMVTASIGAWGAGGTWLIPAGAVAFMLSDVLVARERFVVASPRNVLLGLPLYFLGQALLALSV